MIRYRGISYFLMLAVLLMFLPACTSTATATMQPETTPAVENHPGEKNEGIPFLGILVLLAPAAWIIWQNSRQKTFRKVNAACCLPVIDNDHPRGM